MLANLHEQMKKRGNSTEGEANHWFCTEPLTGKNVREGEPLLVAGLPLLLSSHGELCKEFLREHKGKDLKDIVL
jgi:hypothetical protein